MGATFVEVLRTEVARLQAAHPEREGEVARACALIAQGFVTPLGDGTATVLSSDLQQSYAVNGACNCSAGQAGKPCKHLQAWKLYQRIAHKLEAETPPPSGSVDAGGAQIPPQFLTSIQGKPFVQYFGLLAMAHARGLVTLEARIEYHSDALVLASATATFADGQRFTEWGDATPENVPQAMRPHFIRMALTRAKARCLRDALNIGMCSVEEVA